MEGVSDVPVVVVVRRHLLLLWYGVCVARMANEGGGEGGRGLVLSFFAVVLCYHVV